ncbi:uncharacterized protein F5147DRAFT_569097 [Suillus discolor]|uniref:Metal homeostatis protein bsd2 n=1 Tax=Suillus discolor TaxID=1912936 RepID=A0A9P7FGR8_9AGAM|nr:uncharacterized protein F5147DRAFT_569097 [Suillus discolor]KAG2116056.1 hypothetical protein F5147DRAFT_569097 [Suillus discolor]
MSNRYAPLPNPRTDPDSTELEAAFDDQDDEDDGGYDLDESSPLTYPNPSNSSSYNFESPICDYDQPPPGSPPQPSSHAVPNEFGNSNGIIPVFTLDSLPPPPTGPWWKRTATTILPSHYVNRWGFTSEASSRTPIGGGTRNDGVFSNVAAKPSQGVRVQEGDNVYLVPEESSNTAPPTYAAAQADAAPPYHTHSIFLPSSVHASLTLSQGCVVVDGLPTGTLFSFLWNALISTTFQFVGFVLTWVMHTTHAARYGSRAGLGVTLIQWGFGLRARLDDTNGTPMGSDPADAWPTFASAQDANEWLDANLDRLNNTTLASTDHISSWSNSGEGEDGNNGFLTNAAASEWLSFFLMTAGWFLLLTSVFGFWRVKRWERGIISSSSNSTASQPTADDETRRQSLFERLGMFRVPSRTGSSGADGLERVPSHIGDDMVGRDTTLEMQSIVPTDPDHARRIRRAIERERRLCEDLRAAGLL